jgi:hypothetical protein
MRERLTQLVGAGTLGQVSNRDEVGSAPANVEAAFDALVPRARDDVLVRRYDDGAVAWSPTAPRPLSLEPLTDAVFNLLDGEVSAGDLVADLAAVLEVGDPVAREVLRRELSLLEGAGLLSTSTPTMQPDQESGVWPAPPNP